MAQRNPNPNAYRVGPLGPVVGDLEENLRFVPAEEQRLARARRYTRRIEEFDEEDASDRHLEKVFVTITGGYKWMTITHLFNLFKFFLIHHSDGTALDPTFWYNSANVQHPEMIEYFNRYDTNRDGLIDIKEFRNMYFYFHRNLKIAIDYFIERNGNRSDHYDTRMSTWLHIDGGRKTKNRRWFIENNTVL